MTGSFRLYRTTFAGAPRCLVTDCASFDEALVARDADLLEQLTKGDGRWVVIHHDIVGAGDEGPESEYAFSAQVGCSDAHDVAAVSAWLAATRIRTG